MVYTEIINDGLQKLAVVGTGLLQLQIEHDGLDACIPLSKNEAKKLTDKLIEFVNE